MLLLASAAAGAATIPPIICTLLLIAVILLGVFAFIELIGVHRFTSNRYSLAIAFVVALVLYIVLC